MQRMSMSTCKAGFSRAQDTSHAGRYAEQPPLVRFSQAVTGVAYANRLDAERSASCSIAKRKHKSSDRLANVV